MTSIPAPLADTKATSKVTSQSRRRRTMYERMARSTYSMGGARHAAELGVAARTR
jgi:hypothetical protein